jgi:two-component system cell cycle response regulator
VPGAGGGVGRRVLVVDDSEVTRAILARTLRAAGFEVIEAADGVEGAVLALRERPAVVVTDLEMPILDGFPLLRLLKTEPASAHVPVLILTSHGEAASRFWSERTGADAYLTKDHQPQELVATVERLAAQARPPRQAGEETAAVGPLDVLARIARQLDAALLQATLMNSLLERGMAAGDFHEASRAALTAIGEAIDARFLAVGVAAEEEGVLVHLVAPEPLSADDVWRLCRAVAERLGAPAGRTVDVRVSGHSPDAVIEATAEGAGGTPEASPDLPALDLERTVWHPLPLRGARGVLAVYRRDRERFADRTSPLVEALTGPLALVVDNARLAARLRELSTLDGLTRQLNHRATYERLIEELARAERYGHALSVVLCDLDQFKQVNDTHGHLAGDAVLAQGAAVLRQGLRAGDLLGRYGGEEFLAVLPQVDLDAACQAAERLRRRLEEHATPVAGGEVRITASFGVAELSELAELAKSFDTAERPIADLLVSLADRRLYEAKAAGRNRVRP